MSKGINLLPDCGLPIEKEVARNIEEIVLSCRKELEPVWHEMGMSEERQDWHIQTIRNILARDTQSELEEEIKKRRRSPKAGKRRRAADGRP